MTAIVLSGGTLSITYSVPSATANSAYPLAVEFFLADADGQEGQTHLGGESCPAPGADSVVLTVSGVLAGQRLVATATDANGDTSEFSSSLVVRAALLAAAVAEREARPAAIFDETALAPLVWQAMAAWELAGLDASRVAALWSVTYEVGDLFGAYLGLAIPERIVPDSDAAGYGWDIKQDERRIAVRGVRPGHGRDARTGPCLRSCRSGRQGRTDGQRVAAGSELLARGRRSDGQRRLAALSRRKRPLDHDQPRAVECDLRSVEEVAVTMSEFDSHHSVSEWLTTVNTSHGEAETAWRQLWDRYAPTVTSLARERLTHVRKPLADEDDVVVEVFKELFRGVQAGRFPQLTNRDELQHILATITQRRAIDAARRNELRSAHEAGESALPRAGSGFGSERPLDRVVDGEPPPELSVVACEVLASLLESLEDDTLRQVALMRVFSSTDQEIATAIRVSVRTVQRKVRVIAQRWREAVRDEAISLQDLRQAFRSWQQTNDPPPS